MAGYHQGANSDFPLDSAMPKARNPGFTGIDDDQGARGIIAARTAKIRTMRRLARDRRCDAGLWPKEVSP